MFDNLDFKYSNNTAIATDDGRYFKYSDHKSNFRTKWLKLFSINLSFCVCAEIMLEVYLAIFRSLGMVLFL